MPKLANACAYVTHIIIIAYISIMFAKSCYLPRHDSDTSVKHIVVRLGQIEFKECLLNFVQVCSSFPAEQPVLPKVLDSLLMQPK